MKHCVARIIVVLLCIVFIVPSTEIVLAADTKVTFFAQYRQDVEVTVDLSSGSEISTLDPAIASDAVSIMPIQNMFLSLTDIDPVTNEIRPELATDWSVSDDGLVWTFNLRDDVNWMRYDPATGEAETLRPVVAEDFVFGIKRACDPRLSGYYWRVIAYTIAGCDTVNLTPEELATDALVYGDTTQVRALDDLTLEIDLLAPATYFLSITSMWIMAALPHEAIETLGDDWVLPGNIVTNGPFFMHSNVRGVMRRFIKNVDFPEDLQTDGNIDVINYYLIEDGQTAFALYEDNLLDASGIPAANLQGVLVDYAADLRALQDDPNYGGELRLIYDLAVFYFGYTHDKPPFDNVHVRRAFSAIIDRELFIQDIRQWRGAPMIHFTPPGMLNAPPIDEIGVGFDPEYAREQMVLAGYPDCESLPNIEIVTYTGAGIWAEFWAMAAHEHLGCDIELFNIGQLEFAILGGPFDSNPSLPNAWTLGWGPDYPDAHNWVYDVLSCEGDNAFIRPCGEVDEMLEAAAIEQDPIRRTEMYLEIEEAFFGPEGEYPIAPIFVRAAYLLYKSWYTGPFETDGLFGGSHWEVYSIDMAAKLAAQDR